MTKVTELKRQIQHLTCKRDRTSDSIRESQEQIAFDIKERDELTDQIIGKVCTMLTDQCSTLQESLEAAIERFGGQRVKGVSDDNAKLLQADPPSS